jgi:hypothetical protein
MSKLDGWQEWAVVQLQECFMNGLSPGETAALIGKSEQEVRAKALAWASAAFFDGKSSNCARVHRVRLASQQGELNRVLGHYPIGLVLAPLHRFAASELSQRRSRWGLLHKLAAIGRRQQMNSVVGATGCPRKRFATKRASQARRRWLTHPEIINRTARRR